jgi:hypothetical protein
LERKIILLLPISNEKLLREFAKSTLEANVGLIAIYGPETEAWEVHNAIDDWLSFFETDMDRQAVTNV